jgi:hypothetical protein
MADPYHYIRLQPGPGSTDTLIVGGQDHKSGEANDGAIRFEALAAWIGERVPKIGREVARWSGQVMDTIDYCGFIGFNPDNKRVLVSTGDSGQGMTHGALAGILLKNLVIYGAGEWSEVYEPSRTSASATLNFVRENVTAIKNFAEYLMPGELDSAEELRPGEGGIVRQGMKKLAVSRDEDGGLHVCSAVCTHLGCHVHWNSTEQCWDCPCHGSQFDRTGAVLAGPAIAPLESETLSGDHAVREKAKA